MALTINELRDRSVCTVEEAGEILGLSRGSAYLAARGGSIPTIRLGRRYVVPAAVLLRMLGVEPVAAEQPDARATA